MRRFARSLRTCPISVHCDSMLIEQVVVNLLSNAVKYSGESGCGGQGLDRRVARLLLGSRLGHRYPGGRIAKIFDRFYRARTASGIAGTGIGLNFAQKIMHLHGGDIQVESYEAGGSMFTFDLPPFQCRSGAAGGIRGLANMNVQRTILCIEDEDDLRGRYRRGTDAADYEVLQAAERHRGPRGLAHHRPDLVLCDITMPGLGGYDVLKAMREQGGLSDVPFIFLTALADRNDVLVGKQAGADDYLVKPIDYDLLLATVAAVSARSPGPDKRGPAGRGGLAAKFWSRPAGGPLDALQVATFAFDRFLSAWWWSTRPATFA